MPKRKTVPLPPATVDPQPRPLTNIQELVCHLAADLVMNGGHESDVTNLLRATIGHSLHLWFPESDDWHLGRIKRDLPDWLRRISRHWPAKNKTDPEEELPKTVSEMARANLRRQLRSHFESFLGGARVQDLYLLDNVLMDFDNGGAGADADTAESPLAEAFMLALDSDDTYVKVPSERIEAVEQFLGKLDAEENHEPAEPASRPRLLVFPGRQQSPEVPSAS
jgi:hypothetical protein